MHEYTFDVKLFAKIKIKAKNEQDATRQVRDRLDGAEANFGAFDDGTPIIGDVCLDDDGPDLIEIDGEWVE